MLATGFRAASEVLVAGLLGVVAGVLLRHPSVADRVVAALLGLMLLPLLLTIGLAVRLTSPGPVFVRQARDCATGRTSVLRFRTTFVDGGASSGQPDEARPTPIGRALRRWYLDALPGVVDVLKGDMSLFRPGPP